MAKIDLRDYYPSEYANEHFIDVTEDVAAALAEAEREDHAYYERRRYHKAYYSLNAGDGIENEAAHHSPSPEELLMGRLDREQIYAALTALPEKQRKRIYQHYFLGMSKAEIARAESLAENAIKDTIYRGLKNMENYLKNIL